MKLTGQIIGAAMEVHHLLGPGFLESIYQRALLHELKLRRLDVQTERRIDIVYKNLLVGVHRLDLIVQKCVVIELKAVSSITDVHRAQAISYLKATGLEVALILNFGEASLTFKRVVRTHGRSELEI